MVNTDSACGFENLLLKASPDGFMAAFFGGMVLRLLLSVGLVLVYLYRGGANEGHGTWTFLGGLVTPLLRRMSAFPAPTFAVAHGACLGVGLGLLIATDVVYVADSAKIGSPFANLGATLGELDRPNEAESEARQAAAIHRL